MNDMKYWVALHQVSGIGPATFAKLEARFGDLETAWHASLSDLASAGVPRKVAGLDVILEVFGTDRVMFGSDWPVCLLGGTYSDIRLIVDRYIEDLSSAEKEQIMGLNAMKFYGIT